MAQVGIALPTYNGASFIREGLQSLQNQTFSDFAVYISDNGSTDGTSDICSEFSKQDKRFKHIRFAETVPAGENFTRARDMASTEYLMWRADDDLADPDHLRGLVAGLEANPRARLAVSPILRIGGDLSKKLYPLPIVRSDQKVERIRTILLACHPSWFYGLWRRDATVRDLDRVLAEYPYLWAADHLALLPAILDEGVVLVEGARFIQRIQGAGSYHLTPEKLLAARKAYMAVATAMMRGHQWTSAEAAYINKTIYQHVEQRVARKSANIRRVWKRRIAALIGL